MQGHGKHLRDIHNGYEIIDRWRRYLTDHGWRADNCGNAPNTVRAALAHLTARRGIKRVRQGVYRFRAPQTRMDLPSAQAADLAEATG
jgi:predicted transcriptional regulator of viral defense system